MRNAISWSHDLLTADEQTLFRRLAVFSGGCTLEAAEAIVNPEGTLDVFGGIASLIDKSLLRQEEGIEGEPRFRMLETVREYGLERLEAAGDEAPTIRQGHAAYFAKLAIDARADLSAGVPATVRGLAGRGCQPAGHGHLSPGERRRGEGTAGGWRKSDRILVRGRWQRKRGTGLARPRIPARGRSLLQRHERGGWVASGV